MENSTYIKENLKKINQKLRLIHIQKILVTFFFFFGFGLFFFFLYSSLFLEELILYIKRPMFLFFSALLFLITSFILRDLLWEEELSWREKKQSIKMYLQIFKILDK